jgi:hypothetical protein
LTDSSTNGLSVNTCLHDKGGNRLGGHHLIMGKLTDFLTGEILDDTHDERFRQDIARLLVSEKGYARDEIKSRIDLKTEACGKAAIIKVDFAILIRERICMIIKYGPGSLVTRRRPALAASRLLSGYQIPVVVVTNGREADILDGETGKIMTSGLNTIVSRENMMAEWARFGFKPVAPTRAEKESRILFAYEVDDACPCDDAICRLKGGDDHS